VVITGASSGIGAELASGLARRGFPLLLVARRRERLDELANEVGMEYSVGVEVMPLDLSDPAARGKLADRLRNEPIAGLCNSAGFGTSGVFYELPVERESEEVTLNALVLMELTHAALPGMVERGFGRVINIGSDAGRVGSSLEAVYSGAKGGIIAFTKTLAREVATKGVTVNTVCPGPTDTPALRKFADSSGQDADKVLGGMTRSVPMKRLAQPSDIAAAVAFFASDAAEYITGQTLSVSGGLTMA